MSGLNQSSVHNLLLKRLSPADFDLLGEIERTAHSVKHFIERPNQAITHVCFPETGLVSIVAATASGERLEVGIVGREGMTGLAVVLGNDRSPHETFVQVAGNGILVASDRLRQAGERSTSLQRLFMKFSHAHAMQLAYTALANGRYSLEERLARWLLMSQDRLERDDIPLTHEFLSVMLGVRRAGVTTALHMLEGEGAIRPTRRNVTVLSRARLEDFANDSYGTAEAEYERLIGVALRRPTPNATS